MFCQVTTSRRRKILVGVCKFKCNPFLLSERGKKSTLLSQAEMQLTPVILFFHVVFLEERSLQLSGRLLPFPE